MSMFKNHPNFVKLIAFDYETMTILMQFHPGGSLVFWIRETKVKMIPDILIIIKGICTALEELHSIGIGKYNN